MASRAREYCPDGKMSDVTSFGLPLHTHAKECQGEWSILGIIDTTKLTPPCTLFEHVQSRNIDHYH